MPSCHRNSDKFFLFFRIEAMLAESAPMAVSGIISDHWGHSKKSIQFLKNI